MKTYNKIYESKQFNNIREVIDNAVDLYPNNNAFIIKQKDGKKVEYKNIKYTEFKENINSLGTALINLGLKDKRIAIISKNRYEWILSYISVMSGVRCNSAVRQGLKGRRNNFMFS